MAKTRVIAGIDIGSSKIATLIAQFNEEEERVSVVGVSSIPSKGVRKGQIVDIDEAASSIGESVEKAERMAGYSLDRAYVTVSGGHIDSQNSHGVVAVSDPSGEIEPSDVERVIDAARAVSLPESREILHVLPKEYKVDGETLVKNPEGMSGVRLEVETHLITGSAAASKNITKAVGEVGVQVEELVFAGLASSISVLSETEKELGVVLIDIGGGTTSIAAYLEGALIYSAVLPIGGKNVTNDIAAGLRVSLDSAEKIKLALGIAASKDKDFLYSGEDDLDLETLGIEETERKISKKTVVDGIMRPRLNEIFNMVAGNLSTSGVAGRTPSGIVVTGGAAQTLGAIDAAKRMLALPARLGTPRGLTGLIDEIGNPVYSASCGLLLYGAKARPASAQSWLGGLGGNMIPKMDNLPGRGLVSKVSEIIKNLLP